MLNGWRENYGKARFEYAQLPIPNTQFKMYVIFLLSYPANCGFGSYQINKNILKRTNCYLWNVFIFSKEYTSFYSNLQGIWKEFCPSSSNSHVFLLHLIDAWIVWPTNRSWNQRNTKTQRRNEVRVFFNGLIVSGEELCMLIVLCVKRRVARTNRHCLCP